MTALVWDQVGERRYETGVDRGVLFTIDGDAFSWNGLTNVTEETGREVKAYWMDGIKYLEHHVPGAYSAKMEAYTYPDILDELMGIERYAPGVYLHDQRAKSFHLSYRTGIGNDIDQSLGYKLHIIYNVMAVSSDFALSTIGENVEPVTFSWALSGTPPQMFGARPTSHISLNSRFIGAELLTSIETLLYGSADADSTLPSMVDLLTLIEGS